MNVELREEGLERISSEAFYGCTSLEQISIPSSVKVIKNCTQLMNVELREEGLERISSEAFWNCTTVHYIHNDAFKDYNELAGIKFCEEIEEFVTDLSLRY